MTTRKCIICHKDFEAAEWESICDKCWERLEKFFGFKLTDDGEVIPKDKEPIFDLLYAISELGGKIDYLFHAIEHHSHSTKTVEVVKIDKVTE